VIVAFILLSEIGFWVLIVAGLVVRYVLKKSRASAIMLAGVPLIDLALLIATVFDVRNGGEVGRAHMLAAVYLGVSVIYGHGMIAWADRQMAWVLGGAARPVKRRRTGQEHAAHERREWLRHAGAWLITVGVLGVIHLIGGNRDETAALFQLPATWLMIVVIDFVWSFSYTIFPRKPGSTNVPVDNAPNPI
jgi:hypothetical protein